MTKFTNPLNNLKIASPCSQDWEAMLGSERKRYCGECKLNVYNLSGMTKIEAENLLDNAENRLCVRFYQRADGTVLTQNCPVGWQAVKKRVSRFWTAGISLCLGIFGGLGLTSSSQTKNLVRNDFPAVSSSPTPMPMMGAVAAPTPTPKAKPKETPEILMGKVSVQPKATPKNRNDSKLNFIND